MEIIPAIMPKDFDDLQESMSRVLGLVNTVQVDVMDGVFVPDKTWPYKNVPDSDFAQIMKETKPFPYFDEIDFEVDLMISNPEEVWRDWITAGAKRLIFHVESLHDPLTFLENIRKELPDHDSIFYTEIGLAINLSTRTEDVYHLVPHVDFVQCMGIKQIGFQGQPFDERVIEKIQDLKRQFPDILISVDGGVSLDTAPLLQEAGVHRVAVGSAIMKSDDIEATIEEFKNL